jgi:hypothetical protein
MKFVSLLTITVYAAFLLAWGQEEASSNSVTKVLALEHAWNQAEAMKDTAALDALFDNSLVYIDFDGTLRTKSEFLARVKSPSSQPQQEITESMTAHGFRGSVVVTGVYVAKGVDKGKPYVRRGRFVDTWILQEKGWLCVASQSTPISH